MAGIGEGMIGDHTDVHDQYVKALGEYNLRRTDLTLERSLIAVTGEVTPPGIVVSERAMEVFPSPAEIRAKSKPDFSPAQLARLRPVAGNLGVGRKSNILPSGLMVPGEYMAATEGGLDWKMDAEIRAAVADDKAGVVTACASPYVKATPGEIANMERKYGARPGERIGQDTFVPTQLGIAEYHLRHLLGFEQEENVHMFGYEVGPGWNRTGEQGMLRTVGFAPSEHGYQTELRLLVVDRQNNPDGSYEHQPDTAGVLGILSDAHRMIDRDGQTPIGFFTTPTYFSREVGVARASIRNGRVMVAPTVGADAIAAAKGEEAPTTEAALDKLMNQMPGEFYVTAEQNNLLRQGR